MPKGGSLIHDEYEGRSGVFWLTDEEKKGDFSQSYTHLHPEGPKNGAVIDSRLAELIQNMHYGLVMHQISNLKIISDYVYG